MNIFKNILKISILTLLFSCNKKHEKSASDCKPYFEYDTIEFFYCNIDEEKVWEIEKKKNKNRKENIQLDLLIHQFPLKINDLSTLRNLNEFGFKKMNLPKTKYNKIDEIFCEKTHETLIDMACIPIYRDILVFKNKNIIVGVAKICFTCQQNLIIGSKSNTDEFGQSGDYEKLYNILH